MLEIHLGHAVPVPDAQRGGRPGALAHCHAGRHDANRAEAGAVRAEAAPRRDEVDAALRHEAAERDVIFLPRDDEAVLIVARSEEHTSELQSLMRISYAV